MPRIVGDEPRVASLCPFPRLKTWHNLHRKPESVQFGTAAPTRTCLRAICDSRLFLPYWKPCTYRSRCPTEHPPEGRCGLFCAYLKAHSSDRWGPLLSIELLMSAHIFLSSLPLCVLSFSLSLSLVTIRYVCVFVSEFGVYGQFLVCD